MLYLARQGIFFHMVSSTTTTQLRRGVVGPCILALLSTGPRYGLQLVKELDRSGQLLSSQGTVYPLLNRLHESGLVSSYWEMSDSERPRRYYEITNEGRRELDEFRNDWAEFAGAVNTLMASTKASSSESESR
jgi:PadR family transcriptional regulator PadR